MIDWNKFKRQIENARFDLSDSQFKRMKEDIADLYSIFKFCFDSPRKRLQPYTSLSDYKFKKERLLQSPDDFYSFRYDHVRIFVARRGKYTFSVGACGGYLPHGSIAKKVNKKEIEHIFSNGVDFYGVFFTKEFSKCIALWRLMVNDFLTNIDVPELAISKMPELEFE